MDNENPMPISEDAGDSSALISVTPTETPMTKELAPDFEEQDKNLETVRNILFGEQVRASEKKQASLERFIRASVNSLREETQLRIDGLKHELSLLASKVEEEGRTRQSAVATAQERFTGIEQGMDRLGNEIRADQHEIRQRLTQETHHLGQQMSDWRKEILERLEAAAQDLQDSKTDRLIMAGLLQDMARQLADSAGQPEE